MKRIVVPTDGSAFSDRAIDMGKQLVESCKGQLILLHVANNEIPGFLDVASGSATGVPLEDFYKITEEQGARILEKAKERVKDLATQGMVETRLLTGVGAVSMKIVEFAEAEDADLIIMGSEGAGGAVKGFLLGSVTNKVLHITKIPVLVVK